MSHLQALQIELIEHIVTFLELCDVSSLRLTSRSLEDKASQGSFTTFFRHKNVELTTNALQEMVWVTNSDRHRRLGCFLQHCTITGFARRYEGVMRTRTGTRSAAAVAAVADEGTAEYYHLQPLLTEAFRNVEQHQRQQQHGPKKGLASLSLRVAARMEDATATAAGAEGDPTTTPPSRFRSWRAAWEAARQTFNIAMAALNESRLRVDEHLDVFGGLKGCSLACDTFLAIAHEPAASQVFASLKSLSVSLSAPPLPLKPKPGFESDEEEEQEEEALTETEFPTQSSRSHLLLQDFMQVLRIMPELESLKLHWYDLGIAAYTPPATSSTAPWESNTNLARTTTGLQECSIHGIHVSESQLLHFLTAVHPTSLILTDVRLTSGSYDPIFEYLTDPDTPVACAHLDDIRVGIDVVHFDVPGSPKFPYLNAGSVGPSVLTRQRGQGPIRYRFARGRPVGSGQRMRWLRDKAREFGPPDQFVYGFCSSELVGNRSCAG